MASVKVGECWLAGYGKVLVSQWAWPDFGQNWYRVWWFGSNGEEFIPVIVAAMKKEGTFLSCVMEMKRWVLSDRKVEMWFEKKIIIFIIYEIVCREKILVLMICWILLSSSLSVNIEMTWKTCFTDQDHQMMSGIWNLMTLDGSGIRAIDECYRITSWDVVWKK